MKVIPNIQFYIKILLYTIFLSTNLPSLLCSTGVYEYEIENKKPVTNKRSNQLKKNHILNLELKEKCKYLETENSSLQIEIKNLNLSNKLFKEENDLLENSLNLTKNENKELKNKLNEKDDIAKLILKQNKSLSTYTTSNNVNKVTSLSVESEKASKPTPIVDDSIIYSTLENVKKEYNKLSNNYKSLGVDCEKQSLKIQELNQDKDQLLRTSIALVSNLSKAKEEKENTTKLLLEATKSHKNIEKRVVDPFSSKENKEFREYEYYAYKSPSSVSMQNSIVDENNVIYLDYKSNEIYDYSHHNNEDDIESDYNEFNLTYESQKELETKNKKLQNDNVELTRKHNAFVNQINNLNQVIQKLKDEKGRQEEKGLLKIGLVVITIYACLLTAYVVLSKKIKNKKTNHDKSSFKQYIIYAV